MATRIRLRRDTTTNWTSANPVLGLGEVALEYDNLSTPTTIKAKVGDGTRAFSALPYLSGTSTGSSQPLDADLTAIAALTTTTYGRALLTVADQAALTALLAAATATTSGIVELATTAETTTGTDTVRAVTPAGVKAATDAVVAGLGSTYQPTDATLTALAGVATAANKLIYATGTDTFTTTDLTAAGRALLDDIDAPAQRTTLGLGSLATVNTVTLAQLPAGSVIDVFQASDTTWPARPTARTDIRINFIGYPGQTGTPSDAITNLDTYMLRST